MYQFLLKAHSGFRYVVMLLIVLALVMAVTAAFGKKNYTQTHKKINLFAMVSSHIQLLLGIFLYFVSPFVLYDNFGGAMKEPLNRYWTVEHLVMMLFAIILVTIGHSRSKKALDHQSKHKAVALYYGLAIVVILAAIYQSGRPLFGMS